MEEKGFYLHLLSLPFFWCCLLESITGVEDTAIWQITGNMIFCLQLYCIQRKCGSVTSLLYNSKCPGSDTALHS